jgi:hypothetical protein
MEFENHIADLDTHKCPGFAPAKRIIKKDQLYEVV